MDCANEGKVAAMKSLMGGLGANAVKSDPELNLILERIRGTVAQALQIENVVAAMVDRLQGNRPPQDETVSCQPVRCGLIGEMQDTLDRLTTTLDRVQGECAKLSRIA